MVEMRCRAGVDVGAVGEVEVGLVLVLVLEGATTAEETIGGCLMVGGEDGEGGERRLGRLGGGTLDHTGGNTYSPILISNFVLFRRSFLAPPF